MYTTIFGVAILAIFALFVLFGIWRGKRYVWMYSAIRAGGLALSLILSLFLAKGIAKLLSTVVYDAVGSMGLPKEVKGILQDVPSAPDAVGAILSMILAPIFFLVLFLVLRPIINKVAKVIAKAIVRSKQEESEETAEETKKERKQRKRRLLRTSGPNPIGMACGAVCSLLICFVIFVPLVGALELADSAVSLVASDREDGSVMDTVVQITDAAANNVGSQTVLLFGGEQIYRSLTTYDVGDHSVSLLTETKFLSAAGGAIAAVADDDVPRADAATMVRRVSPAFSESSLIPTLAAELLQAANGSWEKGESYYGIEKPSLGEGMEAIADPLWDLLGSSTYETVKTDVGTVVEMLAVLVEEDAFDSIKEDALALLEDRDLSSAIFQVILSNERLSPLVGEITEYGVQMLGDQLKVDLGHIDLSSQGIVDKVKESRALAGAFAEAMKLIRDAQDGDFEITESIEGIGPLLDAFCETQTVGEGNTEAILSGILEAESVYGEVGFTLEQASDLADSINEKADVQGYTPLMRSLSHTIDVVQLAADAQSSQNKEEMNRKVETLIQDLTPESAEVLQEISSPTVMQNYGVPEQSSEPTADMVSNLFGNLSAAKESGMSEEEYQKEAQATTDLLNLAMSRNEGSGQELFGENGSTGKTASDYVDTVFDSTVVSQTLRETAFPEGEAVVDPLNTGKTVSESEQTQVLEALNEKWSTATEEEKASEDYQKTYLAVGAVLNLPLQLTDAGVTIQGATQG